ncbi:hypothetical protein [Catellatospora coxensis]|nr:hypothetical protein [Catellatospora coxensis]
MHLPDPTRPCHVYRHLPEFADGRPQDDAVALLLEWAGSAGLQPDESHLRWLTGPEPRADRENNHVSADDLVFEMVLALGFTGIPESRPMAVDPGAAPFNLITDQMGGLAKVAHTEVGLRRHAIERGAAPNPLDDWIVESIRLDDELWAAAFCGSDRVAELKAAVAATVESHRQAREASGPPPATVTIGGQEVTSSVHLAETMFHMVARNSLNPVGHPMTALLHQDRRPMAHPIPRPA